MRKSLLFLLLFTFFSCEKNTTIDLLPDYQVNTTINLNLPQFNGLLIPSNFAYSSGGIQGIFIINNGVGNPPYKAFERACPNNDCTVPMTFDGSFKLKCSCDQSEYSIIDGAPQTAGNKQFAREYKVVMPNSSTLIITNY